MLRQRIAGDGPSAGVWLFQESDSPVESNEPPDAEVAELADAPALGAGGRKAVGVRVPSSAFFFRILAANSCSTRREPLQPDLSEHTAQAGQLHFSFQYLFLQFLFETGVELFRLFPQRF